MRAEGALKDRAAHGGRTVASAPITEAKKSARRIAYAARRAAHAAAPPDPSRHLRAELAAHTGRVVSGYMPIHSEIDPLPAMAAHDGPVCVPVIMGMGRPLAFREWTPDSPMIAGDFGARIPEHGAWLVPGGVIVPMVAFDARGYRLGYGGGFYDRTLAALRAAGPVTALGFAYAGQELPELPTDANDQRLDAVVTDHGVRRFA